MKIVYQESTEDYLVEVIIKEKKRKYMYYF